MVAMQERNTALAKESHEQFESILRGSETAEESPALGKRNFS